MGQVGVGDVSTGIAVLDQLIQLESDKSWTPNTGSSSKPYS